MSRNNQAWSDALTVTYDSEFFPLGTTRVELTAKVENGAGAEVACGEREWVFVYNDDTSDFAEGTVVEWDSSDFAPYNVVAATGKKAAPYIVGIAQHAIAAGYYGWVGRKGYFLATFDAGSGVAKGDLLISKTGGKLDKATLSGTSPDFDREIVAVAIEAASATAGTENLLVELL